jgi:hypothetical protein
MATLDADDTDTNAEEAQMADDLVAKTAEPRRDLSLVADAPATIGEHEVYPVALTAETAGGHKLSIPIGAYVEKEGKPHFVPTFDVDGLVAIVMGIGLGWFTVHRLSPIFRAAADRLRRG